MLVWKYMTGSRTVHFQTYEHENLQCDPLPGIKNSPLFYIFSSLPSTYKQFYLARVQLLIANF